MLQYSNNQHGHIKRRAPPPADNNPLTGISHKGLLCHGWHRAVPIAWHRQARALVALAKINISLSGVPSLPKPSCTLCQALGNVLSCTAIFCPYRAPNKMMCPSRWQERSSPAACWLAMRRRTGTTPRAVPYQGAHRNSQAWCSSLLLSNPAVECFRLKFLELSEP